jgi:hypothetical protein
VAFFIDLASAARVFPDANRPLIRDTEPHAQLAID